MEDLLEVVNESLPDGRRPITSLAHPGDLSPKVLSVLVDKIPAHEIADKIRQLLDMKRPTKHGEIPDARAMEAGVKLWLAYCVGLPVQRQEIRTETVSTDNDALMRVLASPAALRSIKNLLAQAEASGEKPSE